MKSNGIYAAVCRMMEGPGKDRSSACCLVRVVVHKSACRVTRDVTQKRANPTPPLLQRTKDKTLAWYKCTTTLLTISVA